MNPNLWTFGNYEVSFSKPKWLPFVNLPLRIKTKFSCQYLLCGTCIIKLFGDLKLEVSRPYLLQYPPPLAIAIIHQDPIITACYIMNSSFTVSLAIATQRQVSSSPLRRCNCLRDSPKCHALNFLPES